MEEHLEKRPQKRFFSKERIEHLRDKAIDKIKSKLLPDEKIIKILLIGSSINYSFGKYSPLRFRGSVFSDFDFIVFVEDDYEIPGWLEMYPEGKPFPYDELNLSYRQRKFIENKYDVEVFFVRRKDMNNPKIQELGERAGIPMTPNTKNKHIIVYPEG